MTLEEFDQLSIPERRATVKRLLKRERDSQRKAAGLGPEVEGRWTFARPEQPGFYFVADREGNPRGVRQLVYRTVLGKRLLCETGIGHNEPGWQGYFWSEPIAMPQPKSEEPS